MNEFQMGHIQEFIMATHQPPGEQVMKKVGKLIRGFLAYMRHLMKLDGTARGGLTTSPGKINTMQYFLSLTLTQGPFDPKGTPGHLPAPITACSAFHLSSPSSTFSYSRLP
jgi:hypothetical protein